LTQRKPDQSPIEAFLAPLARLARARPEIEGLVFWGGPEGWGTAPSEVLEAEEIVFYAEGLLLDGFRMDWVLAALGDGTPDHLRLSFWQEDAPEPPMALGWQVLDRGRWTGPEASLPG
jgi:hypothetical protein